MPRPTIEVKTNYKPTHKQSTERRYFLITACKEKNSDWQEGDVLMSTLSDYWNLRTFTFFDHDSSNMTENYTIEPIPQGYTIEIKIK